VSGSICTHGSDDDTIHEEFEYTDTVNDPVVTDADPMDTGAFHDD